MSKNVGFLTEMAMMAALALILSFINIEAPWAYGGSISLEMLPIVVMGFRRGVKGGVITGVLYGFLQLLTGPTVVHPLQFLLDYPIAYGLVGLCGIFHFSMDTARSRIFIVTIAGAFVGSFLRFLAHFLSGIVYFGQYAPEGVPVMVYSLVYNAGYMIPSFILTAVLSAILFAARPELARASR